MKIIKTIILFIFVLCFNLSFSQKKSDGVSSSEFYTPKFSFDPQIRSNVASSNIVIVVIKPTFSDKEYNQFGIPFSEFTKSMISDIEEVLISKGYKVRGPFLARDEMVFNDKMNSDFTLEFKIDLTVLRKPVMKKKGGGISLLPTDAKYRVSKGDISISTKLIITAVSNFSGEKLWKKNLELDIKNFTYVGSKNWDFEQIEFTTELKQDMNLWNPFAKNLENIYIEVFKILERQFDQNEMNMVKEEAIKEKPKKN